MQDTDNKSPELIKWHLNLKQIQLTLRRDKTCLCCSWRAVSADTRHASRVIRYRQEIETQIANCYDILHILCRCRVDCDIVCDHKTKGNSGLLSHRMRVQYLFSHFESGQVGAAHLFTLLSPLSRLSREINWMCRSSIVPDQFYCFHAECVGGVKVSTMLNFMSGFKISEF